MIPLVSPLTVAVAVFLLGALLPFAARPVLQKLGIVDVPVERSSHSVPVLRGLGLATLGAMLIAWAVTLSASAGVPMWVIAVAGLASGLLGIAEDLRGVSVPVRSALQLLIAIGASVALVVDAKQPLLLVVYAVLFISSFINVANFMDGLNGISGFHAVIAGATFAIAGAAAELSWLVYAGVILAAAFAGFLIWNLSGRGFLGDVGSYLLGGVVATTSFAAFVNGVPMLATIGPMIIYFGDVGWTLVKRVRRGDKWSDPHKEHVYQQLQQKGLVHVGASAITAGFTLVASGLGLLAFVVAPVWQLGLLLAGLLLVVVYRRLPRLIRDRNRENTA